MNISFAKIGEVYFCEVSKVTKTTEEEVETFKNEKFKFKREKNVLKFGSGGFFDDHTIPVIDNFDEVFYGGGNWDRFIYVEGRFVFSNILNLDTGEHSIYSVVAGCDAL